MALEGKRLLINAFSWIVSWPPAELTFFYRYTSGGEEHNQSIPDWEVQATYLSYQREYGSREKALAMMAEQYGQEIPPRTCNSSWPTWPSGRGSSLSSGCCGPALIRRNSPVRDSCSRSAQPALVQRAADRLSCNHLKATASRSKVSPGV